MTIIYMLYSWVRTSLNFGHSEIFGHPTYVLIVSRIHFGPLTNKRKTQIDKLNSLFPSCSFFTREQTCKHLIQVPLSDTTRDMGSQQNYTTLSKGQARRLFYWHREGAEALSSWAQ